MTAAQALLARLADADEPCLRAALNPSPRTRDRPGGWTGLDRRLRALVRLGALLAIRGPRESVCWATELAATSGVSDDDLAAVLIVIAPIAGTPSIVAGARRLATALGYADPPRRRLSTVPTTSAIAAPITPPAITSLG